MSEGWNILIVDDHPTVSSGTKLIMQQIEQVKLIGIVDNGQKCMAYVEKHKPDLIILDYNLPDENGYHLLKKIKSAHSLARVIIFTGINYLHFYNELIDLGVHGIISKNSSDAQFKKMVEHVMDGQTIVPYEIFQRLHLKQPQNDISNLTIEEHHLMALVIEGYTHEQIAKVEYVSKRTVDNYLKNIYKKLSVQNRVQAIEKYTKEREIQALHGE